MSLSTRKAVIPLWRSSGCTLPKTMYSPASPPLVIHSFRPLSSQSSPSGNALSASAKASEPLPASESA